MYMSEFFRVLNIHSKRQATRVYFPSVIITLNYFFIFSLTLFIENVFRLFFVYIQLVSVFSRVKVNHNIAQLDLIQLITFTELLNWWWWKVEWICGFFWDIVLKVFVWIFSTFVICSRFQDNEIIARRLSPALDIKFYSIFFSQMLSLSVAAIRNW